jgi:hypothetical protein
MNKFKHLDVKLYDSLPDEYIIINIVVDGLNFELDNLLQVVVVEYSKYGEIIESSYSLLECDIDVFMEMAHKLDNKYAISCNPRLIGKFIYSNLNKKTDLPNIHFINIADLSMYFDVNDIKSVLPDFYESEVILNSTNIFKNINRINKEYLLIKTEIEYDLMKKEKEINTLSNHTQN